MSQVRMTPSFIPPSALLASSMPRSPSGCPPCWGSGSAAVPRETQEERHSSAALGSEDFALNAEQLAFSPYQSRAFLIYSHTTLNVPDLLTTEPGISWHRQAQSLAMHDLAGTCTQLSLRRDKATFTAGPRTQR